MKSIRTRWGASVTLSTTEDDELATQATLIIGIVGEEPVLEKTAPFSEGIADLSLTDEEMMAVDVGEYSYQINVDYSDGRLKKYPEPTCRSGDLPDFIVYEALDNSQVS